MAKIGTVHRVTEKWDQGSSHSSNKQLGERAVLTPRLKWHQNPGNSRRPGGRAGEELSIPPSWSLGGQEALQTNKCEEIGMGRGGCGGLGD